MNRLWLRLSIAFSGVLLLVGIVPFLVILLLNSFGVIQTFHPPEGVPPDVALALQRDFLQRLPRDLLRFVIISSLVGIAAGIWMSRSLTAPLTKLEEAARAIGAQNLSRRVEVVGSEEVVAVAEAFNDMADKLEKAEALRQNLLADVAHELRTPITVIQGNLRAILDDVYPLDKEELARLYDQTRHLTRLVNDLHELAQAEARQLPLNIHTVDTVELVQETSAAFRPMAEEAGVGLRVELLGKVPCVQADAARLTQALHNLLANALRHTPAGGLITLQAEGLEAEEQLRIAVHDTGRGIAPEHLSFVFDRFYRTDRARARERGGTGLGLAIVRAVVEAHGGRVVAESAGEGQGSTFTLYLPAT